MQCVPYVRDYRQCHITGRMYFVPVNVCISVDKSQSTNKSKSTYCTEYNNLNYSCSVLADTITSICTLSVHLGVHR